jgi:ribonucleoside-triphosphate reductase
MKKCGLKTETYSRVCGYFSAVSMWNRGKLQEFKDRKNYEVGSGVFSTPESSLVPTSLKKIRG